MEQPNQESPSKQELSFSSFGNPILERKERIIAKLQKLVQEVNPEVNKFAKERAFIQAIPRLERLKRYREQFPSLTDTDLAHIIYAEKLEEKSQKRPNTLAEAEKQ
jgi:hypothetical protein